MSFILFWVSCMVISGIIASSKEEPVWAWVLISLILGPIGVLIILLLPSRTRAPERRIPDMQAPPDLKTELAVLKSQVDNLCLKLGELEKKIDAGAAAPHADPQTAAAQERPFSAPLPEPVSSALPSAAPPRPEPDMELKLGKYWLNRVGIAIFTLGVGFLITYTFKSLGAWAKIGIGYAVSAFMFYWGTGWEREEKMRNFGRVLLGGAWAIVYFTTYAMYHFDASRVLNSQAADLALLAIVSAGIIAHSLKYRSQELSGIALFIGYITVTMGDVNYFTLAGCAILAVTALILTYKLQWIKLIFTGIILTYASHAAWVLKHIYLSRVDTGSLSVTEVFFFIHAGFLSLYWLLFTAGIHGIRSRADTEKNSLAAANFLNIILFFFLAYPKISFMYPALKFAFVCDLGAAYLLLSFLENRKKNERLFVSDTVIAVMLLTLAIPLKFTAGHTTLIWLVELPFLLLIGLLFDKKVFRYLSMGLALLVFLKFLRNDYSYAKTVLFFGRRTGWNALLSFAGLTSMSWCYYIYRSVKTSFARAGTEISLRHIFSLSGAAYCASWLILIVPPAWATFFLSLEMTALITGGYLLKDRCLRFCAFVLSLVILFRVIAVDKLGYFSPETKWFLTAWFVSILYAAYSVFRRIDVSDGLHPAEQTEKNALFWGTTGLFLYLVHDHTPGDWISLALGAGGLCLFTAGFLIKDRFFRFAGFVFFAVTLARVFIVDLSGLPLIYKFVSFILLGTVFLGVSFVYNKSAVKSEHDANKNK